MKLIKSFSSGISSLTKALNDYYKAWTTLGSASKLKAEAELLEAVHKKLVIDEKFSDLDETEVKQAKEVVSTLQRKIREERLQISLLLIPIAIFLLGLYATIALLLEVIRAIFA